MWYLLVAQSGVDAISGMAGWTGAGLLGGVLGWLLFVHLPAKDKQINTLIDNKDKALAALMADHSARLDTQWGGFNAILDKVCDEFRMDMQAERAACEKNYARLAQILERRVDP